jgi:hypothetical protein
LPDEDEIESGNPVSTRQGRLDTVTPDKSADLQLK